MSGIPEDLVAGLGTTFLPEVVAKTVVVLGATWVIARIARRASAATRYAIWIVGLSVSAAIPAGSLILPDLSLPLFAGDLVVTAAPPTVALEPAGEPSATMRPSSGGNAVAGEMVGVARSRIARPTAGSADRPARGSAVAAWVFVIWWGGVVLALIRLVVDWIRIGLLTRHGTERAPARVEATARAIAAELGIHRRVRVLTSSWLAVPVNWGMFRPVVLVPREAAAWDPGRLRVVLLHEFAHVRRWDYLTHFVTEVACALHWANPIVWLAARRARSEQEQACDDAVLRVGTRSTDYAEHLVEIARAISPRTAAVPAALAMAAPATLGARVRSILARNLNRGPAARRTIFATALLAAFFAVPLASANIIGASAKVREVRALAVDLLAPDPAARSRAAWRLGRYETATAASALVTALADPVAEVRGVAALSLGEVGHPASVTDLLRALEDQDPFVRENAVLALNRLRDDPRAHDGIVAMAADTHPDVRSVTVWALGELGSDAAAEALAMVVATDTNAHTRGMAVGALVRTGPRIALPRLLRALASTNCDTRADAAHALGRLGDRRAVIPLLETLRGDSAGHVRRSAAMALERMPDPRAIDGLLAALGDSVRTVRQAAVRTLGKIDDPRAEAGVLRALRDPVHQVRLTAAWVLQAME